MPTFQELKEISDQELIEMVPELTVDFGAGPLRAWPPVSLDADYQGVLNVFSDNYRVNGIAYKMSVSCVRNRDGDWHTRSGNTYIRRAAAVFTDPTPAGYDGCHAAAVRAVARFVEVFPDWQATCLLVATEQSRRAKLARAAALRVEAAELEAEAAGPVAAEVRRLVEVVWPPAQVTKPRPAVWRPAGR